MYVIQFKKTFNEFIFFKDEFIDMIIIIVKNIYIFIYIERDTGK